MRTTSIIALSALLLTSVSALTGCSDATSQNAAAPAAPALPTGKTPRPADAELYIISPADGATVGTEVTVQFGLKGMGVAPAGIYMGEEMPTGHHHLLIDVPDVNTDTPVMKDARHVHFGGGQTEATITLTPGEHTLQLILGDHGHVPHDPPLMSEKITVTVK